MLRSAVTGTHRIAAGRAEGLMLAAPRAADRSFARGDYEPPVQDVIADSLSPGDVFYDIGANIGFFSLVAARAVGSSGHVYAFEPVPQNVDAIHESARLNNLEWVDVFAEAVGARTGRDEIWLTRHIGGAALASADAPPDVQGRMEVDVVTLDLAISSRGLRPPTLVKVDVEGAEIDVLAGMAETMTRVRPAVLYEIDDATSEGLERKAQGVAEVLTGYGYTCSRLPPAYGDIAWHVQHFLAAPSAG